jgi:O-6-methylguanine DNA methyltransferase
MIIEIPGGPKILISIKLDRGKISEVELTLFDRFALQTPVDQPDILEWLSLYAQKKQPTPLSLDINKPPFTYQILTKLLNIGFGETTTYQSLAKEIGKPKAARAVGNACGSNPFPLFIPCHRVLHTSGGLGGFSCGLEIKRRLLAFEGR